MQVIGIGSGKMKDDERASMTAVATFAIKEICKLKGLKTVQSLPATKAVTQQKYSEQSPSALPRTIMLEN